MPGINQQGTLEHWHTDLLQCLEGIKTPARRSKGGDDCIFVYAPPNGPNKTDKERKVYPAVLS